ncbi:MAG: prepilin peptidase [Phycisphaerales bacterium]
MIGARVQPGSRNGSAKSEMDRLVDHDGGSSTRRLWRPLSYRPAPPKDYSELELVGDRAIGVVKRMLWSRRRLRRQAEEVLRRSGSLESLAERAFDEEIERAREAARRGRRDAASRTHAFAVVREAVRRVVGLKLYPEQVMGGWVMEDGCIAEMLTGEGKTVTACLTAAVQGWMGYGVHVITVNDYLARRDAELNAGIYKRLGLTVGVIQDESDTADRREAYARDITYATDQQVIFDYLRDSLHSPLNPRVTSLLLDEITDTNRFAHQEMWSERVVLRGLFAAIIDEADSVLIDQATTPAIIGVPGQEDASSEYYRVAARIARTLEPGRDFKVDVQQHHVELTDAGRDRLESIAHELPPFWAGPRRREEIVTLSLTAHALFHRDDHYIVRNDDVHIVDPQTGRVLEGRQWQLGLHQAIQAKEELPITGPRETRARVAYQRFFQLYRRTAGMTGTAWEVRSELWTNYDLPVVRIPPHRPVIRRHERDRYFTTRDQKFEAVAEEVDAHFRRDRPVLVGTRSVEASEQLSELLHSRSVPHQVLNAARHEEEAAIVAKAGRKGAVTVATNMAGRGTDIILGPGVRELGGLVVLATERHDSRRIDRQLYGRAGRQGDPGLAQTFVSLDDQLVERSGLRPLTRLGRSFPTLLPVGLGRLIWGVAQWLASKREYTQRRMAGKADLWFDRAMYYERR